MAIIPYLLYEDMQAPQSDVSTKSICYCGSLLAKTFGTNESMSITIMTH